MKILISLFAIFVSVATFAQQDIKSYCNKQYENVNNLPEAEKETLRSMIDDQIKYFNQRQRFHLKVAQGMLLLSEMKEFSKETIVESCVRALSK